MMKGPYTIYWRKRSSNSNDLELRWYWRPDPESPLSLIGVLHMEQENGHRFLIWMSSNGVEVIQSAAAPREPREP